MALTSQFRPWITALLLIAALMLLTGCGDDPEPTPTPVATIAAAASSPEETTPANIAAASEPTAIAESPLAAALPIGATAVPTDTAVAAAESAATEVSGSGCAIEPNPDLVGYDDVVGRLGCPISDASSDPVGINEFGEGPDYDRFMLWFGSEGQIYVLTADGRWLAYTDTWQEDEPEILCNPGNLDPATSPPIPRRGFGKLWCTVDTVRTAMGYIDREERLCQHSVVQRFQQGRLLACFEDATIRYFRILENGDWDLETVQ